MPVYAYKAKDSAGNTRTGTLEADSERAAAAMIREAGGLPMDIRLAGGPARQPVSASQPRSPFVRYLIDPIWTGVNLRALVFFFRQLATLLSAGMSLSESLRSVGSRTHGRLRRIIEEAALNVQGGGRLSDTMARHPRAFGSLPIALVRAGESGGLLAGMTDRIASNLEYELTIRRRLAKVMFYPFVVFAFIVFTPHLPTLVLKGGREFGIELWRSIHLYLPLVAALCVLLKLIMQFRPCRLVWDTVKMAPPVLGPMARKVAMSRFCRAVSDLYAAGVPIGEALTVAADASANMSVACGIRRALPSISAGEGLTQSLSRAGVLTPIVLDMLSVGEKTGNMDAVLIKAAEYMDQEVDATIYKTGIAIFIVAVLVAAWVVLQMAISFYVGNVNNAYNQAGQ